jgi:hypothetical protein
LFFIEAVRNLEVADIHAFVTDAPPPRAFAEACTRAGVEIAVAEVAA